MKSDDVLGRRVAAALLDVLVLALVFVFVAVVTGGAQASEGQASARVEGTGALAVAGIILLYYLVGEAASGQTAGKRIMGLRVVDADGGGRVPLGRVVVRTLLRIVDNLPGLYLLGFVCILVTGQRRARLGDLAARTRVVRAD